MTNVSSFILIPQAGCEAIAYSTDTLPECQAAAKALREAGLESAGVYAGAPDDPDAYLTSSLLWAAEEQEEEDDDDDEEDDDNEVVKAHPYTDFFRDGPLWVAAETGMPEQHVRVGVGDTAREAVDSLETTAIQSTGRDCGLRAALEWACNCGWCSHPSELTEA